MAFQYNPTDGLRNVSIYPSDATSDAAAREYFQGLLDQIKDHLNKTPRARVYNDVAQAVATGSVVVLNFNTERYDNDTIHDNVTNNSRLTCKTAGVYRITANAAMATGAGNVRTIYIRLNGTTYIAGTSTSPAPSNTTILNCSCEYELSVNDYVEVIAFQDSGSSLNTVVIGNCSPEFSITKVGEI